MGETESQARHDSEWKEEQGLAMIPNQVPVWNLKILIKFKFKIILN